MSSLSVYCSSCASLLEADCDFCPSCGTQRLNNARATQTSKAPHSWMGNAGHQNEVGRSGLQSVPQYAPSIPYDSYSVNSPTPAPGATANTARKLGILTISLMAVGLIPCIGWLNYINFPLAFVTVIVSIVASSNAKTNADRSAAMIGLAFALIAGFVGFIRLLVGGGCL